MKIILTLVLGFLSVTANACPPHTFECNGGCIYSLPSADCREVSETPPPIEVKNPDCIYSCVLITNHAARAACEAVCNE